VLGRCKVNKKMVVGYWLLVAGFARRSFDEGGLLVAG